MRFLRILALAFTLIVPGSLGAAALTDTKTDAVTAELKQRHDALRSEFNKERLPLRVRARVESLLHEQRQHLGADHPDTCLSEILLAKVVRDIGELQAALELVDHALIVFTSLHLEATRDGLEARLVKGQTLDEMGRSRDAAREFERFLAVATAPELQRFRQIARAELVLSYTKLGRLGDAASVGEEGLREQRDDKPDAVVATLLDNLAGVYLDVGRIDEAVAMQRRAQAAFEATYGPDHEASISAASNLARTLDAAGLHDEALQTSEQTARRLQALPSVPPRNLLLARLTYAQHLLKAQRLEAAAQELQALLPEWDKQFGADDPGAIDTRHALARISMERGQLQQARREFEAACRDYERIGDHQEGTPRKCPMNLATVLWKLGERRQALDLLGRSLIAFEGRLESGRLSDRSQQTFFAERIPRFRQWAEWSLAEGDVAGAFAISERTRARMLLQSIVLRHADASGTLPAADAERLADMKGDIERLTELAQNEENAGQQALRNAERDTRYRELAALRDELRKAYPRYAAVSRVQTVAAPQATRLLAADMAAITYLIGETRLYAFVLTRDRPLRAVDLGPLDGLADEIRAALMLLDRSDTQPVWQMPDGSLRAGARPSPDAVAVTDWRVASARLGRRLLAPLAPMIAGRKHLLIVPDGVLAQLPFEPLIVGGKTVVESFDVRYVQSMSVYAVMKATAPRSVRRNTILSVGAPDFPPAAAVPSERNERTDLAALVRGTADDPAVVRNVYERLGAQWAPLPGAEAEISRVQAIFAPAGGATALVGSQASEPNLQRMNGDARLAGYRLLHVATHGYLNNRVPALSAIVLSQTQVSPAADGYLTAAEIPSYRFDSDLIVLSACDSGRGTELAGEGVMGLPYALFVAGNRAAVMTLWKVVDASSARFVSRFFEGVKAGMSPSAALARTKREFMQGARATHPQHWAGFVLYGS